MIFDDDTPFAESMPEKTPEEELDDAISAGSLRRAKRAIAAGADVINGVKGKTSLGQDKAPAPPLLRAVWAENAKVLDTIIQAVIKQSEIPGDGIRTEHLLAQNLLDCYLGSAVVPKYTLAHWAARQSNPAMFAAVWPYFRGKRDINRPDADGAGMIHHAARIYPNLACLLKEGADVNMADKEGVTPLMQTLGDSPGISKTEAEAMIKLYEQYHARFDVADKQGRNLAYYAQLYQPFHFLDYVLGKGVDPFAPDKDGNTPADYVLATARVDNLVIFYDISACHGYNVRAHQLAHSGHPAVKASVDEFGRKKEAIAAEIRAQKGLAQLWEKIWEPGNRPSPFLLTVCGYESLNVLFEHPIVQAHKTLARELYRLLEEKLPDRCKGVLHTTVDRSHIERNVRNRTAQSVTKLLKRKVLPSAAPDERSRGGR